MRRTILAALFFAVLIAIWAAVVQAKIWSPILLPSPQSVGTYILGAAQDGTLWEATLVTVKRLVIGYVIGILIGLPLGFVTAASKFVEDTIGVLALGCRHCRASAGCRSRCSGSVRPKGRCCSSSSWARSGRS